MPEIVDVVRIGTVQMAVGGLFDGKPIENLIHLDGCDSIPKDTSHTLCGIDMFDPKGPGFSRGGGVSGPMYRFEPCPACRTIVHERHPFVQIVDRTFKLDWSKP